MITRDYFAAHVTLSPWVQVPPVLEASGELSRGLGEYTPLSLSNVPGTRVCVVLPSITDDPASLMTPDVCTGRGISTGHPTLLTSNKH